MIDVPEGVRYGLRTFAGVDVDGWSGVSQSLAERGRELEPAIGGRGVLVVGVEWGWQSTLS